MYYEGLGSVLQSPIHEVKHPTAFIVWTTSASGTAELWLWDRTDSSSLTAEDKAYIYGEGGGPVQLAASQSALALLLVNGGLLTWGSRASLSGCELYRRPASDGQQLVEVAGTDAAFAARSREGKVVACGQSFRGGIVPANLSGIVDGGVAGLVGSAGGAFAAWTAGLGRVFSWGSRRAGGDGSLDSLAEMSGVREIWASEGAFAALRSDGYVYTWGNCYYGGCLAGSKEGGNGGGTGEVQAAYVVSAARVFTALLPNRSVQAWGPADRGGQVPSSSFRPTPPIDYLVSSRGATCVLSQSNTSLTCWGAATFGGDCLEAASVLQAAGPGPGALGLVSTDSAFALLFRSSVLAWGDETYGGHVPDSLAGQEVVQLVASQGAFAALTRQGVVVVWGDAKKGGRLPTAWPTILPGVVRRLVACPGGFLALTDDAIADSVGGGDMAVAWGEGYGGPSGYATLTPMLSPPNSSYASLFVV
ncbi:hypothetical protein EON64_10920 [archaeon]|nr:MAG: hypothetical protein EON64_10920 [archaeon]